MVRSSSIANLYAVVNRRNKKEMRRMILLGAMIAVTLTASTQAAERKGHKRPQPRKVIECMLEDACFLDCKDRQTYCERNHPNTSAWVTFCEESYEVCTSGCGGNGCYGFPQI
jgi:hypothetical protein